MLNWFKSLIPMPYLGEPSDVANGVLYLLASDESKFVNGAE